MDQERFNLLENKGEFLSSGVDVYRISLDDELFSKWLSRALLTKIFHNMPFWINQGNSKLFYDTVYTLAIFMNSYKNAEYTRKTNKVYENITEETNTGTITDAHYVHYGNELLNIVIDQMRLIGWFVTTREVSASLTTDKGSPIDMINEYYEELKKADKLREEGEAKAYGLEKKEIEEDEELTEEQIEELEKPIPKYDPEEIKKGLDTVD